MKLAAIFFALVARAAFAQTPPIQPKVQESASPPRVLVSAPPSPLPVFNKPLNAEEVSQLALHFQQSLVAAAGDVMAAKGRAQGARAALMPNLVGTLSNAQSETIRLTSAGTGGGSSGTYTAAITARQLIFDFNHTRDLARQSALQAEAAQAVFSKIQNDFVLQVKQAFYAYVQTSALVTVSQSNVANSLSQLALAKARFNAGVGQPADMVSAETNLSSAQQTLIQAQTGDSLARMALAQLIGVDPRTPIVVAGSHEGFGDESDLNALVDLGLHQRPEAQGTRLLLWAARSGVLASRTIESPSLGLSVSAAGKGSRDPTATSTGTATLGLSWTFDDGGLAAGKGKEARAAEQSARAQQIIATNQIVADVSQAYLSLKGAQQRKVISAAQVQNAIEGVRIAQGRYQAGLANFIEITNAQALLVSAQTSDVNAEAAIDQARASLGRATGQRPRALVR